MVSLYRASVSEKPNLPADMVSGIENILTAKLELIENENGVASMQPVSESTNANCISVSEVFQVNLLENLATPVVKLHLRRGVQKNVNGLVLFLIAQCIREGLATFFSKSHNIDIGVREANKDDVYTGYYFYLMDKRSGFEEFREVLKASSKETQNQQAQQTQAVQPNTGWGALANPQVAQNTTTPAWGAK